jgi:hypothetical protein
LCAVFVDLNGNTLRDAGEGGVTGVTVQVSGASQENNLTTDAAGEFLLTNPPTGVYTVTVSSLAESGYLPSGLMTRTLYLPASGASASALFTVLPANSILGNAAPGTELTLVAQPGTLRAATSSQSVRANNLGFFLFADVQEGDYQISVTPPPGFTQLPSQPSL